MAESHPPGAWVNAVLLLIFAYGGFEAALIPAGEVKNPARDAPVALMSALVIVTTVYFLVQVVVVHMLANPAETDLPLSVAAHVFGGSSIATIISVGALLSSIGYFAANMIATPRITFAFAEQGDFPRWFAAIHRRYHTPYISIIAFAVLVWALTLVGTFRWNAALSTISRLFVYGMTCAALPMLRRKLPGRRLPPTGRSCLRRNGNCVCAGLSQPHGCCRTHRSGNRLSRFVPKLASGSCEHTVKWRKQLKLQ